MEFLFHHLRDYTQEVEAAVVAKLPTWKAQHLGLWVDLVEPPTGGSNIKMASASELQDLEDEAQSARFRETRTKLAQDVAAMCAYNTCKEENNRRSHVVKVMHEKSQLEIGKELLCSILVMLLFSLLFRFQTLLNLFSNCSKNVVL